MKTETKARHLEIGSRIRAARLGKKMRQVDLAAKAGLSWRHLIRMERGEGGEPKPETVNRIAEALGVERSELTGDEDDEESDPALREAFVLFVDLMGRLQAHRPVREEVRA